MSENSTRVNRRFRKFLWLLMILVVFTSSYEGVLRYKGVEPFRPIPFRASIEPEFIYGPSSTLGYAPKKGVFKITMYDLDSLTYHATHNDNSQRITRPIIEDDRYRNLKNIYFFGGSFTYGAGVDDSLTFCWALQKAYPQVNLVNFAVPGYGPLQALIQLKQALKQGNVPGVIILNYSFYHDNTSTLPRKSRANIVRFSNINNQEFKGNSQFPFVELSDKNEIRIKYRSFDDFYSPWPLRDYSALINFLEHKYNEFEFTLHDGHYVSKQIIAEIELLCAEHNITLVVAGMTRDEQTREMLRYCTDKNILNLDISTDLSQGSIYRLHKNDSHPGILAHAKYAKLYIRFFKDHNVFNRPRT